MESCFHNGKYHGAQCQREDCPHAMLWEAACTYGTCHTTLSTLWEAARLCRISAINPTAAASGVRFEVSQAHPQASSEAPAGNRAAHEQSQPAHTAFSMHTSPISKPEDDPYVATTQTWLTLVLLPEFSTACYLNDLVKLASTSRMALEPAVENQLALIRYQVAQHRNWHEDWIEQRCIELDQFNEDFDETEFPHRMCLSCGIRSGAGWLGNTECYECYSEH